MELFRIYPHLDSTNKEAARLLAAGAAMHGTAILAHQQTEGRGQYGRSWHAEPGQHMALSVVIQPYEMRASQLPQLSMLVSLAIVNTLQSIDSTLDLKIKWPNDIYANDKKLAGILIENLLNSSKVQHCIIGIGMNVHEENFPEDIPNPTSLRLLTDRKFNIEELAIKIKDAILNRFMDPVGKWKDQYDQFIYGLGNKNVFELNGDQIAAIITGVDVDGKIILENADGESKSYFAHEIKWKL